jgi:hypothetical protein
MTIYFESNKSTPVHGVASTAVAVRWIGREVHKTPPVSLPVIARYIAASCIQLDVRWCTEMAVRSTHFCLLAVRTQLTNTHNAIGCSHPLLTSSVHNLPIRPRGHPSACHNLTTNSESLLCRPIVSTDRSPVATAAVVTCETDRERRKYTGRQFCQVLQTFEAHRAAVLPFTIISEAPCLTDT